MVAEKQVVGKAGMVVVVVMAAVLVIVVRVDGVTCRSCGEEKAIHGSVSKGR